MQAHSFESPRQLRICLINPRFDVSYWGYEHALPLFPGDKRNMVVTGALPALAALVPAFCDVTLLDENVEDIHFQQLAKFDVVGVTGMIVQRQRMHEILAQLQGLGPLVVVGGPYVTVAEAEFTEKSDVRFIGEAEETWPVFLHDLAHGRPTATRYTQADRSDMALVPTPRYDPIKANRYVTASLQFSRGCPFLCEFCDIITIFGRRPRTKTPEQMLKELDAVRLAGFKLCFLVDDNFIGNKAKARDLLKAIIGWQEQHGYPLVMSTEASINLADEPELLDLMLRANFRQVFIGLESPRPQSLMEIRKVQNLQGDSVDAKIQRIQDGGIVVKAGFIVGFDNDDAQIFDEQFSFIQRNGIAQAMLGPLSAIPGTPLHDRLKTEGRLTSDNPRLNFKPKLMTPEALLKGYDLLMQRLYAPDAYFERLLGGYARSDSFRAKRAAMEQKIGRKTNMTEIIATYAVGFLMTWRLWRATQSQAREDNMAQAYWRQWQKNNALPRSIRLAFPAFVRLCIEHWHFFNVAATAHKAQFGHIFEADAKIPHA